MDFHAMNNFYQEPDRLEPTRFRPPVYRQRPLEKTVDLNFAKQSRIYSIEDPVKQGCANGCQPRI